MRDAEDSTASRLKLSAETLAVSFSESSENAAVTDFAKHGTFSSCKGGKTLFRKFVRENISTVWKPQLVKSMSNIKFGGYLQDPPTLLLQGESKQLQQIRDALSHRLLKAPPGYHIDFVGDITRIGARPLMRGNFVPLCDGICVSIGNVSSRGDVATQEAILEELKKTFPEVHSPSRELLHETLGKLIRHRKVFCTGPGYHLVTSKTYAGKSRRAKEISDDDTTDSRSTTCLKNRVDVTDTVVSEETNHQITNTKEYTSSDSGRESFPTFKASSDCPAVESDNVFESDTTSDMDTTSKRPPSRKSLDREKRSSIVGKVADKLFRRRRKTSSDGKSETESQLTVHKSNKNEARQLNKEEAIRRGYEVFDTKRSISPRVGGNNRRSSSETRVVRSSSFDSRHDQRVQKEGIGRRGLRQSKSFKHESRENSHPTPQVIPDVVPEAHRQKTSDKSVTTEPTPSNKKVKPERSISQCGRRDVAVSCNLDTYSDVERIAREDMRSPPRYYASLSRTKNSFPDSISSPDSPRRAPRRARSLRLPREQRTRTLDTSSSPVPRHEQLRQRVSSPPTYSSPKDHRRGFSYDTLRKTMNDRRVRRSMSSVSSGREYSYQHSCRAAPSVKIGSVIADHMEELERRRHYLSLQRSHESSPSPIPNSETSQYSPQRLPDFNEEYSTESVESPRCNDEIEVEKQSEESEEKAESAQSELDVETEAALKVAKRLAELDIKMTRQEWKDYFALKILPQPVEDALRKADKKEQEDIKREENQTYFESTSGSVETVIDVRQREKAKLRRSRSSHASSRSTSSSEQIGYSREFSDRHPNYEENDYAPAKRPLSISKSNDSNNNTGTRRNLPHVAWQSEYPSLHRCPYAYPNEVYEGHAFYTCSRGHKHLSLCDEHTRVASHADNASLTEDSGFHSTRDRNSLSSWDRRRMPRGTFV